MSSVAREKYLCYLGLPKYHETAFAESIRQVKYIHKL